ncbi:MAG: acyl carrier protein [Bacteroidales bacterium]|nr:acyl carrier protein [Bacteroidales bacterium]
MKTLDEFVSLFADLFDETDRSEFSSQTVFHDLDEWSSLMVLNLIAMTDEEFNRPLKDAEIKNAKTIEDLYNIIKA